MATSVTSTATKSSDIGDQMSGANLQMEGHPPTLPGGRKSPEDMGTSGSTPSWSPSWLPKRSPSHSPPGTWYCLGIHITLTNEIAPEPPPSHAWMASLVEDMLHYGRTGLTEAVMTGPGRAVLFYGRWSLGEDLSLGEARDALFTLTRAGTWVCK